MFKKPAFWISFTLITIGLGLISLKLFPLANPIVDIHITMDRSQALSRADSMVQLIDIDLGKFNKTAMFRGDQQVQNFVELELGGVSAFRNLLENKYYYPYFWEVRYFREDDPHELLVRFTPDGKPYGFLEKLSEQQPGPSITSDSAYKLAVQQAQQHWATSFDNYNLVEKSSELLPGGRVDHSFVFENRKVELGAGRIRLRLTISGDHLSEITHWIKIPETFTRKYQQMRSANQTISGLSTLAMVLILLLMGVLGGLIYLFRKKYLAWKMPLLWGYFISFLLVLLRLNQFPLLWMSYDTSIPISGFLIRQITTGLINFMVMGLAFSLVIAVAESLTRIAFPSHLQFWKLWKPKLASSSEVIGRTLGGYFLVASFILYDILLYFVTTKYLGWWSPSSPLVDPNILSTYFPWLNSLAISLQAGFFEECLFRAIPLAGAAIIGKRLGKPKLWIGAVLVIQAFIFGAAHANYPQQPAYARVVELLIPSLAFGLLYLRFGLLPVILMHFFVDVVYISVPVMISSSPWSWINKLILLTFAFLPIWIVLYFRIINRKGYSPEQIDYNKYWKAKTKLKQTLTDQPYIQAHQFSKTRMIIFLLISVICLILWWNFNNFKNYISFMDTHPQKANELAVNILNQYGLDHDQQWKILQKIEMSVDQDDEFIWQEGGPEVYQQYIGNYLTPAHWSIRFAKFKGDLAARAEEFQVFISHHSAVYRYRYLLPESASGGKLDVNEARELATGVIFENYSLNPENLEEISAVPTELPNRLDWSFTFQDLHNYPLDQGAPRIKVEISGEQITDCYRFIHVPEQWIRDQKAHQNIIQLIKTISTVLFSAIIIFAVMLALISVSKKKFSLSLFLLFSILLASISLLQIVNNWPSTEFDFSTAQPLTTQVIMSVAFSLAGLIIVSLVFGLINGYTPFCTSAQKQITKFSTVLLGLGGGLIIAGIEAVIKSRFPSELPNYVDYSFLSHYIPIITLIIEPLFKFILGTTIALFIVKYANYLTRGWKIRRILTFILFLVFGLTYTGIQNVTSLTNWLTLGSVYGLVFFLLYFLIYRYQTSLVIFTFGVLIILAGLIKAIMLPQLLMFTGWAISTFIILIISYIWFRFLTDIEQD